MWCLFDIFNKKKQNRLHFSISENLAERMKKKSLINQMPWQQLTHCGIKIPACETITHKSTKDGCESERIWEMGNIRCRLLQLSEIRLLIYDEGIQPCALLITL